MSVVTPLHAQTLPHESALRTHYGSGAGQNALPRGGTFEPRIEAAIQYADNLNLVADGVQLIDAEPVSAAGVEAAPGFYASYAGDNFSGAADYSLIARWWDESAYDDVTQELAANGRWTAIHDLLYVDGQANYLDAVVTPRFGLNYGGTGVFGSGNIVEVATAGVTPTLQKRFGGVEAQVQYTYGRVWYADEPDELAVIDVIETDDATHQAAHVSVGTADDDRRLTGEVFYDWNDTEYELAQPFRYDQAGIDVRWRLASEVSIVADVGLESDLEDDSINGGLDESFWHAGLRWQRGERSSVEARFGQQFFGDSYLFAIEHVARYLRIEASYSEMPVVENRLLVTGEIDPGSLPPTNPGLDYGRLTTTPYVSKDGRATLALTGSRTEIRLTGYSLEREYLRGFDQDEKRVAANLRATRRLSGKLSCDVELSYQDYEYGNPSGGSAAFAVFHDYDSQALLRFNRSAGSKLTFSLESGYFTRAGTEDYDGWWAALRTRYTP